MKCSKVALMLLAAKESGFIKSNSQFWLNYSLKADFLKDIEDNRFVLNYYEKINEKFESHNNDLGVVCTYDEEFPIINSKVKNNSEKPYLLFYRGDLKLLNDLNNNVAVIGHLDPDEEIVSRESEIITRLVKENLVIVSGLAKGCDTVAHLNCLKSNGKTIAILPSALNKIYPKENSGIAEEIVTNGGLLITEYYGEANSRREAINRFIERDRLQAMFAKAIILIASYRKGEGDSGSRHAMESALKYGIDRYVMYNKSQDNSNLQFGLNKDLLESFPNNIKILLPKSVKQIKSTINQNLLRNDTVSEFKQLSML